MDVGPTCSAMVVSSLNNDIIYPDTMANYYVSAGYRTASSGTAWSAFAGTASKYGIEFKQTGDANIALDCVKNGGMVVISAKGSSTGLFSTNGHFVVLVGVNGDNYVIYDPDLYNGKYNINGRASKATVNGKEIYVSISNTNQETRQYFCYYKPQNISDVTGTTKAKYVKVNSSLNVRSGPGTANTVVGSLQNNTLVTVYEENNGFSKIGEGKWVSSTYLQDAPEEVAFTKRVMTVTAKTGLNVRESPNTSARVVTAYKIGTRATIYEITNGWAKGIKGWMKADYLE